MAEVPMAESPTGVVTDAPCGRGVVTDAPCGRGVGRRS